MEKHVAILNFAGCSNYGANLTAYALSLFCSRLGYTPALVDRRHLYLESGFDTPFSRFGERYLSWTTPCYGEHTFLALSADYDTFIVGSDQVWSYQPSWSGCHVQQHRIFDFADLPAGKKRIAMAASFGNGDYSRAPINFVKERAEALHRFTAISVREESGLSICRDCFGVRAEHVLDPVFLISTEEWGHLADVGSMPLPDEFAAFCTLHSPYVPIRREIASRWFSEGLSPVNLLGGEEVVDWVNIIRRCKVLVTDSFHAVCFGIIFRKPIIFLNIESRGGDRVPCLSRMLGVQLPIFTESELLGSTSETLDRITALRDTPLDYSATESILADKVVASHRFLQQAMEAPMPDGNTQVQVRPAELRAERRNYLIRLCKDFFLHLPQYLFLRFLGLFRLEFLAESGNVKRLLQRLWRQISYTLRH